MIKHQTRLRNSLLATGLCIIAAACVLVPPQPAQSEERTAGARSEAVQDTSETYRQLNLFGDVFERVRAQYVEEMTDKELIETAINGMLVSLDPHSSYLNEDDFREMQVQTRGEFGGLGIEVTMENGLVKVVSPIDDTPAYQAGIQAGDLITHLDGEQIMGMNLSDAVERMRGRVGTTIELTVRRENVAEPLEFTITRDIIRIRSVRHEIVEDSVGYIRITTFNQHTESGVKTAIEEIEAELGERLIGYVLDMRNNPGGLLDQAIHVTDIFLDKGEIVSTRGRHEHDTKRDNATAGDLTDGKPVVVLINSGSASASEIVAGALQDHRRALVLGTPSFGKGSVQTVIPLPGHGAMRLTTARYYTPSGRSIQAKGIDPDITIEAAKIEQLASGRRVQESDLRGALRNDNDNSDEDAATESENAAPEDDETTDTEAQDIQARMLEDYQLSRAVDLIRGVSLYKDRLAETRRPEDATESNDNGSNDNNNNNAESE